MTLFCKMSSVPTSFECRFTPLAQVQFSTCVSMCAIQKPLQYTCPNTHLNTSVSKHIPIHLSQYTLQYTCLNTHHNASVLMHTPIHLSQHTHPNTSIPTHTPIHLLQYIPKYICLNTYHNSVSMHTPVYLFQYIPQYICLKTCPSNSFLIDIAVHLSQYIMQ